MNGAARYLGWLAAAIIATGCATASQADDDDQPTVDAAATADGPVVTPDATPGQPDAAPIVYDATPGTPDATPVINADAPPGGVCTANQSITCGQTINGNLTNADDSVSGHACSTTDALRDDIYSFTAPGGTVNINLNVIEDEIIFGDDFDVYVHQVVCDPAQCLTHGESIGDESISFNSTTNQLYYIIVEEYAQGLLTAMDYSLQVTCP
jgi:hypothetical protein